MEPLNMILIFVLVVAITYIIALYYKKKEDNYDILNRLVEQYGPDVTIQNPLTVVSFGKDMSSKNLDEVVNNFLNNVSQKLYEKDSNITFPISLTEENADTVIDNVGTYLTEISIKTNTMLREAKTKEEVKDYKNILTVITYIYIKFWFDISSIDFISYFSQTNRVKIISDELMQLLFEDNADIYPDVIEFDLFKELIFNYGFNTSRIENYVNYELAKAQKEVNKENENIQYLANNFESGFRYYLKPLYQELCTKDETTNECVTDFETYYTEKSPQFEYPEMLQVDKELVTSQAFSKFKSARNLK